MNTEYLDQFVEEARENIEELVAGLLRLENEAGDEIVATVGELFRFAHNVKGMAATIGLESITIIAHRMEDLFERYRQGGGSPSSDEIDLLLAGCDAVSSMIDEAATGTTPAAATALIAQFDEYHEANSTESSDDEATPDEQISVDEAPVSTGAAPESSADATHRFAVKLADDCQLPGARGAMVLRTAAANGTVIVTVPPQARILSGAVKEFTVDMGSIEDAAKIVTKLSDIADVESAEQTVLAQGSSKGTTEPVAAQRATVRVGIDRLDVLMDLVSELVIARGQLEQQAEASGSRETQESVAGAARLISDLQAIVAKVRMVTLEATFRRMNRLVRDTARTLDKQTAFKMDGAETELDRRMVDELSDPLVHLLRNAVDHGVETVAERTAAGKQGEGEISLSAYHEGNQVVIEVIDNGAGIDVDRVCAKAIENGLVTADDVAAMSHSQKLDLVFAPGLSTRTEASTISGRGVGMDVVRSSVNRLGGSVQVESTPGEGSRFRVRLPLSLAVLEALLVTVADETWAVPLAHIEETIIIHDKDLRWIQGDPVINLRGVTLPVIPGRWELAGSSRLATPTPAIVYQHKGRSCALMVDQLLTQTEVVVKPLPSSVAADYASGVTILGNGTVGLILDLDSVTEAFTGRDRTFRMEFVDESAAAEATVRSEASEPALVAGG